MGRYLDIAAKVLREERSNTQSLTDASRPMRRSATRREKSEFSERSPTCDDWSELLKNRNAELTEEELPVAIAMVAITDMRLRGIIPDHYTATTECKHCGPVPIWEGCPPEVEGCPWCFNRLKGLHIPRTRIETQ